MRLAYRPGRRLVCGGHLLGPLVAVAMLRRPFLPGRVPAPPHPLWDGRHQRGAGQQAVGRNLPTLLKVM